MDNIPHEMRNVLHLSRPDAPTITRAMLFAAAATDAVALIGEGRKILGLSPDFYRAAQAGDVVRIVGDLLGFIQVEEEAIAACSRALSEQTSFPYLPSLILLHPEDRLSHRLSLQIARVTPALGEALSLPVPAATVKLVKLNGEVDRIAAIAASACKLTTAEARLLVHLLRGETVSSIARSIGTKQETIRSQLKSIFLKTGVSRQSALISYVMTAFEPSIRVHL